MTGLPIGMMVELLVAILLLITIGYCVVVHGKLKWLKSDQAKLIKVIGELNAATANAEHAVAALSTVSSGARKDTADTARAIARGHVRAVFRNCRGRAFSRKDHTDRAGQ